MKESTLERITSIEEVQQRFKMWREKAGRSRRIPEDLWESAVRLCRFHPVGQVCRRLGLGYYDLKERAQKASSPPTEFIELGPICSMSEVCVDFESDKGRRMRIHCKGSVDSFLPVLLKSFWEGS